MSDLIERDKVINILDRIDVDIIPYADARNYVQIAIDHIRKQIENIIPARQKGKWVELGQNKDGTHNIRCVVCGKGIKSKGHANSYYTKDKFRFCPTCGADMREREGE